MTLINKFYSEYETSRHKNLSKVSAMQHNNVEITHCRNLCPILKSSVVKKQPEILLAEKPIQKRMGAADVTIKSARKNIQHKRAVSDYNTGLVKQFQKQDKVYTKLKVSNEIELKGKVNRYNKLAHIGLDKANANRSYVIDKSKFSERLAIVEKVNTYGKYKGDKNAKENSCLSKVISGKKELSSKVLHEELYPVSNTSINS